MKCKMSAVTDPRYNFAEETEVQKHKDLPPKTEMPVNVWLPGRPIAEKFLHSVTAHQHKKAISCHSRSIR